ncbi:hypothetical protein AWB68_06616 [Caballeronia choica]|uniref:Response regulator receiver protein n=2 Tax=Caballeronia choica TaxID=326476 RepID=A0A158KNV6_9BURK|nr:hypothetical protein AWB68_06616 [Caballeronia choica]
MLSGIDLAKQFRGMWPAQKFALMTGDADEFGRAKLGKLIILAKPFYIEELRAQLSGSSTVVA